MPARNMKKYEKLVLLLIVLVVMSKLGWLGRDLFIAWYFGTGEITPLQQKELEFIPQLLSTLLNVGSGIWLFVEARREKVNKWIWAFFGLVFSLTGVLLYYLVQIYTNLRDKVEEPDKVEI